MNSPQGKAYMASIGFVEGIHGEYWVLPGSAPQISVDDDAAAFLYARHIASTRKVLERLQAKGHGGGNWRRLIELEISALERKGGEKQ